MLVMLSPTKAQVFGTLSLIVRESGWPLDVTLVGPAIAARLKLDTNADFSSAAVAAALAAMRIKLDNLEIDYELERKPPKKKFANMPQLWVVHEKIRPGAGLVGRDQLLAVGKVLLADTAAAEGSDVAMSSTLYSSLLDFEVANGEATTTVDALHDAGSSFHAISGRNSSSAEYTALLAAVSTCTDATTPEKWVTKLVISHI